MSFQHKVKANCLYMAAKPLSSCGAPCGRVLWCTSDFWTPDTIGLELKCTDEIVDLHMKAFMDRLLEVSFRYMMIKTSRSCCARSSESEHLQYIDA